MIDEATRRKLVEKYIQTDGTTLPQLLVLGDGMKGRRLITPELFHMRIEPSRLVAVLVPATVLGLVGPRVAGASPKDEAQRLVGEWMQSYTTKDANSNRILDEAERKRPDANEKGFGIGFLQFDKEGKVAIDKRLRHKGRYKIVEQAPRDQLVIEMDSKDIGTYRFLIIEVSDKELVLEPSLGTFTVYRRP